MSIRIDFLSYEGERNNERHPHAQFVLPIAGELEISIGGAEGRLTPSCAAFVAPGVPHSQLATVSNAFLIVNCDLAECGVPAAEQLAEQIFLPVSEATRHLIGFAELSRDRFSQPGTTQCWMPLLLNSFLERPVCRPSRLAVLERLIDAHPARRRSCGRNGPAHRHQPKQAARTVPLRMGPQPAGMAGGTPYRACAEMAGGIGSADCGSGAAGRVRRSKRAHPRHAAPDRPDARRLPEANAIGTKKQESGTRLPDPPVILSVPA